MQGIIKKLYDDTGNIVFPVTSEKSIYMEDGKTLGSKVNGINDQLNANLQQNLVDRPSMIPNTLSKLARGEDVLIVCGFDSITAAIHHGFTKEQSYTAHLANMIAERYPNSKVIRIDGQASVNDIPIDTWSETTIQNGTNGQTIRVMKCGVGGDTILRMYRRANDFLSYNGIKPDLIISMEGINDSLSSDPQKYVPLDRYEKGYQTFIQFIKRKIGCEIVLQTSHWHGESPTNQYNNLNEYIEVQKKVAKAEKIQIIDQKAMFDDHWVSGAPNYGQGDWFTNDPTHPLEPGHIAMAKKIDEDLFVYNQYIIPLQYPKLKLTKYDDSSITYGSGWSTQTISSTPANTTYDIKMYFGDSSNKGTLTAKVKGKKIYLLTRKGLGLNGCDVQVDGLPVQNININTPYPQNINDISNGSIASYFYERILIADGLDDVEHTIQITNAIYMPFYGFESDTAYEDEKRKEDYYTFTGDGTSTFKSQNIVFTKPFPKVPIGTAQTESINYYAVVSNETVNGLTLWVRRLDNAVLPNGTNIKVKWIASIV